MYTFFYFSLPQEDSDYERERLPPTPPPPRRLSRRGAAFKLACLGKQDSDENPLMRKVATPLKLAQAQVCFGTHHSLNLRCQGDLFN